MTGVGDIEPDGRHRNERQFSDKSAVCKHVTWRIASKLGIRDREKLATMSRLHIAVMRGIAIELRWSGDEKAAEDSMRLLNRRKEQITGELLTEGFEIEIEPKR